MPAGYEAILISQQGDSTALTASTTATTIINPQAKWTMPANFFDRVGRRIRIVAGGRISTVTTPGTLTLSVKIGSVVVAISTAMVLSTTAKTNVTWMLWWDLVARSVGASTSATLMHIGEWVSEAAGATTVAGEAKSIMIPTSAPAVGTGFDSTTAAALDLQGTWSISNADSIQTHMFDLYDLGP